MSNHGISASVDHSEEAESPWNFYLLIKMFELKYRRLFAEESLLRRHIIGNYLFYTIAYSIPTSSVPFGPGYFNGWFPTLNMI